MKIGTSNISLRRFKRICFDKPVMMLLIFRIVNTSTRRAETGQKYTGRLCLNKKRWNRGFRGFSRIIVKYKIKDQNTKSKIKKNRGVFAFDLARTKRKGAAGLWDGGCENIQVLVILPFKDADIAVIAGALPLNKVMRRAK